MSLERKKLLFDMQQAASQIEAFTEGRKLQDYRSDAMLRSAVERQFEVVGEALAKLARLDEAFAHQISEFRRIIAFRNILIHGYAQVDDELVWDIVQSKLPVLQREVNALLEME